MNAIEVDTTRLPLLLHDLRLPAIARLWRDFAERADKEGWPAVRFLSVLAELELAERGRRRVERHLVEGRLPPGKTLDNFDFSAVPMLSKARVMALAAGDTWLDKASNLLLFRAAGCGQESLRVSDRPRPCRERLSRPVHPHHGYRAETAGCPAKLAARGSHCQTRQVRSAVEVLT
jgi:DNA replication protein DnaC